MISDALSNSPRQPFLSELAYRSTLAAFEDDYRIIEEQLAEYIASPCDKADLLKIRAQRNWSTFQLRFTMGADPASLAAYLTEVVQAYEAHVEALRDVPEDRYYPPFMFDDMIDNYVDYVNLLSAAVLLHREDLIPRIAALNKGTEYDQSDAVIERLLGFYLPDRPRLEACWWNAYSTLAKAVDLPTQADKAEGMAKYVRGWYRSMKGVAHFWGKHEKIQANYSPYDGYWAMCAAAFTYLLCIDDTSFRDELVYPKDMVDYARSVSPTPPAPR